MVCVNKSDTLGKTGDEKEEAERSWELKAVFFPFIPGEYFTHIIQPFCIINVNIYRFALGKYEMTIYGWSLVSFWPYLTFSTHISVYSPLWQWIE